MTDAPCKTDFDDWIVSTFGEAGAFTMLFVLLAISEARVDLLRSAYLHVVGDDTRWQDMITLLAGAGVNWSGVVFYRAGPEGLVEDHVARGRLASLVRNLNKDRSLIREGEFFNVDGLRLSIQEIKPH
ncbi:hypothetical protein [Ensifer sp. 4252]|uniref:hypothetical protein n=1 Tax=Ensifer sp. 4252 TaxID=3373915 RepID=UPI003D1F0FFD